MKNKADIFLELTDSLSRYQRAELKDDDNNTLIEDLYVDPLNNDLILKSMLQNNTTLLVGRKGTGKSTIINRFQHEIRKSNNRISLYVDVKSLFEQAKGSYLNSNFSDSISRENFERLSLYQLFIKRVIEELKREINKSIFKNPIVNFFFPKHGLTEKEFKKQLDVLFDKVETPEFRDSTAIKKTKENNNKTSKEGVSSELKGSFSSIDASIKADLSKENISSSEFTRILTRYFNIIDFMNNLKDLLSRLKIDKVFICLDDMSEIDKSSMEVFVNFIVAPLNGASDEYFKFKISLYPGRIFFPSIDMQKVKTFHLDYYDLYSRGQANKIEESAIEYTKKLIEKRFQYYYGKEINFKDFFQLNSSITMDEYYKLLFQVSSNVPRIIGKILNFSLQKSNAFERKITKSIIKESAKQHYIEEIEYVLTRDEYIKYRSYDEAFEKYHLLELLKNIIGKAIANKKHIGIAPAKIFEKYTPNTAPSNYFHVTEDKEKILQTLEFNFFITKYSKQQNKDSNYTSVFSLNYGLCKKNNIIFDEGSDRKFRTERIFDFNELIEEWMNNSKELVCSNSDCQTKYPLDKKEVFIKHNIPCLKCQSKVELKPIINIEQKKKLDSNIQLQKKDYDILIVLRNKFPLRAKELGNELDRHYQSINQSIGKNSKIKEYDFVKRFIKKVKNKDVAYFELSEKGISYINNGTI